MDGWYPRQARGGYGMSHNPSLRHLGAPTSLSDELDRMETTYPRFRHPEFVWVVCNMDYGDNGWSIQRIFLTRDEADQWAESTPNSFGYWKVEKHHVGDTEGDLYGSQIYEAADAT